MPTVDRTQPLRIAILEAGSPPARLGDRFSTYGAMTARLLGSEHACTVFDARAGHLPDRAEAFEACAITGSAAGVNDSLPWIATLVGFLRALPTDTKCVGLCFGHQIMAEAFGGRVENVGWGLGLHTYDVVARAPYTDDVARIVVPVTHQDQVVERPPGARVLAGSRFTPNGVLAYADRAALSCQCHPEFEPDFFRALTEGHRAGKDDPDLARAAMASLAASDDRARVGAWIRRFLAEA
ncbi:type 1 glutamine amidotransferase [uncultured Methylobacterium sp.]|uniref:type 1 glutamine amidotransferase n=1 Tax=uncultured Methylobacterium sp. TaxID=157278 RepID=UPI0035CC728E